MRIFVKVSEMKDDFVKFASFLAFDLILIIFVKNK